MVRFTRTIHLGDPAATEALGRVVGRRLVAGEGVALIGELGAGKTGFTRGLGQGLGIDEPDDVASPTYLLMVEHPGPTPLLHVDAYLPAKCRAVLADGGLDYVAETRGVLAIEWADRVPELWPPRTLVIRLSTSPDGGRVAELAGPFRWIEELDPVEP